MNIAVNTRLLLSGKLEGIGWFTYENLKRITQNHPEHHFIFIFDRIYSDEFIFGKNITPIVAFPQARHPILWYLYFDWAIPRLLKKYKADLFLSPDGWLSLRTDVKSLPVIHDLNFFHFPRFNPRTVQLYYSYFFPKFILRADRIATVSEFTKNDILSRFGYKPENIDVVYNGANTVLKPIGIQEQLDVRKKFTGGCPYFLFVGLVHARKNVDNLIRAFDEFRISSDSKVKLVIVGSLKYWNEDIRSVYEKSKYREDILLTGHMESDELHRIIASALAMVYVSSFEGFGIPILEAMYCDIPVITSNTSSMPEVGGDAAIYADPASVTSIKNAMLKIYKDPDLCNNLIEKGRIQRTRFNWDKTSALLWNSIEQCLKMK